jgi:hypothetical protein
MKDIGVRIRGIYATALTKYLVDKGYRICHVSGKIASRLKIPQDQSSPDVDVKHNFDRQGISVVGAEESLTKLIDDLRGDFIDIVTIPSRVELYGLYKGKNFRGKVDLGGIYGFMEEEGGGEAELLVQVAEIKNVPLLSRNITFSGDYVILIPQGGIKISKNIKDRRDRTRLFELGRKLSVPNSYGVLWRTASMTTSDELLMQEVEKLSGELKDLFERYKGSSVGMLRPGKRHVSIIFGSDTKKKLDFIRNNLIPTSTNHHKLKSGGKDIALALAVYEEILRKHHIVDDFEGMIRGLLGPKERNLIRIEHVKLDGRVVNLGEARIAYFSHPDMTLERKVYGNGVYDGLDVQKDNGDKIVTEVQEKSWYIIHKYYSPQGRYKGSYYNICTPIEFYPTKIRYIDLEIDVVKTDRVKIIDREVLEQRVVDKLISERLAEKAIAKAEELAEELS